MFDRVILYHTFKQDLINILHHGVLNVSYSAIRERLLLLGTKTKQKREIIAKKVIMKVYIFS